MGAPCKAEVLLAFRTTRVGYRTRVGYGGFLTSHSVTTFDRRSAGKESDQDSPMSIGTLKNSYRLIECLVIIILVGFLWEYEFFPVLVVKISVSQNNIG